MREGREREREREREKERNRVRKGGREMLRIVPVSFSEIPLCCKQNVD